MKLAKISSSNEKEQRLVVEDIDTDLTNLFTAMQGLVRFGAGTDGSRGENISGEFQQFTSDASSNTEFSVAHTLGAIPIGYLVLWQDKNGNLYQGPSTGTAWTSTTIYLKGSNASMECLIFLLK